MATLDNFVDEILDNINEFSDAIKRSLEERLDDTADKILSHIKSNAPRSGGKDAMADSFIKEDKGSGINKTVIIYAKEKGRLIHLIEFGFTHKGGKYVPARPFMRPAYDTFTPKMLDEIREIIKHG